MHLKCVRVLGVQMDPPPFIVCIHIHLQIAESFTKLTLNLQDVCVQALFCMIRS